MSMDIQKQIKDNSTTVSDFFTDLYRWTEDQDKQERRRDIRRTAEKKGLGEAQRLAEVTSKPPVVDAKEEHHGNPKDAIKRDKTPMAQYYNDWGQYDPEAEVEKIEDETFRQQKAEREERQAQADRILDEMALKADGDRSRTSTARPRVKISVRRSGRKIAPVDLATPRKEEANRLFSSGRYREAIASYSAGLDCLEKYEPPGSDTVRSSTAADKMQDDDDGAGQETEAIALKVALLANRGLACLKLEEWRECIADCSEALRFDPEHHKAILRRGFAQARLKRWGLAAKDLGHALATDPQDKKASAELQMARRMLSEQAKEARARAKCVMCDPTRAAVMPTRRLQVKVHRGDSSDEPAPAPQISSQEAAVLSPSPQSTGTAEALAEKSSSSQGCQPRQPYVPRSVRLRGRQVSSSADKVGEHSADSEAVVSSIKDGKMATMSFYQFEARWSRLRSKQCERAAFLRKTGAENLPALFRESLDSELLASILEAIASDLADTTHFADASAFAVDVLGALSRTQRFELSIHSLTADERQVIDQVLGLISERKPACSDEQFDMLCAAFKPLREEPAEEELDEDDIVEDRQQKTIVLQEAVSGQSCVATASFSLDDCD